jgi:hypothetical protein
VICIKNAQIAQSHGLDATLKQKQDSTRESTVWLITKMIQNDKYKEIMVTYKEIKIKENK